MTNLLGIQIQTIFGMAVFGFSTLVLFFIFYFFYNESHTPFYK